MPRHIEEIKYLLGQSAKLDVAVAEFAKNLAASQHVEPWPGVECNVAGKQITVTLHGKTVRSRYEQLRSHDGEDPLLFARLSMCLVGDDDTLGDGVATVILDRNGDFFVDGTAKVRFGSSDVQMREYGFREFLKRIASAIVETLPIM